MTVTSKCNQSSNLRAANAGKTSQMHSDLRINSVCRSDGSVARLSADISRCISVMDDEQSRSAQSTSLSSAGASEPLEAASSSVLFRRLAVATNKLKAENEKLKSAQSCSARFPEWRNNDGLLVGLSAVESNLFRLRVVGATFSLIAFVLMMTVEDVPKGHFHPYAQSWVSRREC